MWTNNGDSEQDQQGLSSLIQEKRAQLEGEFEQYLEKDRRLKQSKKGSKRGRGLSKHKDNLPLKNFINSLQRDNKKKGAKVKELVIRLGRLQPVQQLDLEKSRSRILRQLPSNNHSRSRISERSVFGSSRIGNFSSSYMPVGSHLDSEFLQMRKEQLEEDEDDLQESQKNEQFKSGTLEMMRDRLTQDIVVFKDRNRVLKEEGTLLQKQGYKCENINNSIDFMNLAANSKLGIAKDIIVSKQKEAVQLFEDKRQYLEDERKHIQDLEVTFAKSMIERDAIDREERTQQLQIFTLDDENEQLRIKLERRFDFSKPLRMLRELDGFVDLNRRSKSSRIGEIRVLDEEKIWEKYEQGFEELIEGAVSLYEKSRKDDGTASFTQNDILDSLMKKKVILEDLKQQYEEITQAGNNFEDSKYYEGSFIRDGDELEESSSKFQHKTSKFSKNSHNKFDHHNHHHHHNDSDSSNSSEDGGLGSNFDLELLAKKEKAMLSCFTGSKAFSEQLLDLSSEIGVIIRKIYGYQHPSAKELMNTLSQCQKLKETALQKIDLHDHYLNYSKEASSYTSKDQDSIMDDDYDDQGEDIDAISNHDDGNAFLHDKFLGQELSDFLKPREISSFKKFMRGDRLIGFNCSPSDLREIGQAIDTNNSSSIEKVSDFYINLKKRALNNLIRKYDIFMKIIASLMIQYMKGISHFQMMGFQSQQEAIGDIDYEPNFESDTTSYSAYNERSIAPNIHRGVDRSEQETVKERMPYSQRKVDLWMNPKDNDFSDYQDSEEELTYKEQIIDSQPSQSQTGYPLIQSGMKVKGGRGRGDFREFNGTLRGDSERAIINKKYRNLNEEIDKAQKKSRKRIQGKRIDSVSTKQSKRELKSASENRFSKTSYAGSNFGFKQSHTFKKPKRPDSRSTAYRIKRSIGPSIGRKERPKSKPATNQPKNKTKKRSPYEPAPLILKRLNKRNYKQLNTQ